MNEAIIKELRKKTGAVVSVINELELQQGGETRRIMSNPRRMVCGNVLGTPEMPCYLFIDAIKMDLERNKTIVGMLGPVSDVTLEGDTFVVYHADFQFPSRDLRLNYEEQIDAERAFGAR